MRRCIELATLGAGFVAPNPMVGAVLVHEGVIIGEGYHKIYGGPHAEVNCIASVPEAVRHLIGDSAMYVSLEPCAHHGQTPPCADLIIRHGIREVIVGCRDPFPEVDGKGIEKLEAAGTRVMLNVLESECRDLNKRFFTFHTRHRPYVTLKWAQTSNGKIGNNGNGQLHISGNLTNRLVHKWRSEEASILVGTNTARLDNPRLTNRFWDGPSPVRIVIDLQLKLPASLHLFDGTQRTIVINQKKHEQQGNILFYRVPEKSSLADRIVQALYQLNILSVIVEGGAKTLQTFIDGKHWDEARMITNASMVLREGVNAPALQGATLVEEEKIENDLLQFFVRT